MPPNPASIPSATSLAREWLAEAIIGHSILTQSGWWACGQGFQTGTAGWLCYQGQCPILEAWESVTWILLVVIHSCSLLTDWARPSDSQLLITEDTKHECFHHRKWSNTGSLSSAAYWSVCKFWRAVTCKPLQHPFDLVQASWAACGGLGGWFHSRATDVAAPIAGLIGIGYVALTVTNGQPYSKHIKNHKVARYTVTCLVEII